MTPARRRLSWLLAKDDVIAIPKTGTSRIICAKTPPRSIIRFPAEQLAELDRLFPPPAGRSHWRCCEAGADRFAEPDRSPGEPVSRREAKRTSGPAAQGRHWPTCYNFESLGLPFSECLLAPEMNRLGGDDPGHDLPDDEKDRLEKKLRKEARGEHHQRPTDARREEIREPSRSRGRNPSGRTKRPTER